jgi:hypothetical protein
MLPLVEDELREPEVVPELPLVPLLVLLLPRPVPLLIEELSLPERPVAALNSLFEMRPSLSASSVLNWLERSMEPAPEVDEPVYSDERPDPALEPLLPLVPDEPLTPEPVDEPVVPVDEPVPVAEPDWPLCDDDEPEPLVPEVGRLVDEPELEPEPDPELEPEPLCARAGIVRNARAPVNNMEV